DDRSGASPVAHAGEVAGAHVWRETDGTCVVFTPVNRPYRVVVAKPGLDGHDRGAKVIARALRDAGFEVIYTGLHQTPEQVVEAVIQEDADAVGCSLLSGAHMTLFPRILDALKERGADDVLVFGGGIIPDADIPKLKELGVAAIFTPGASMASITEWLEQALDERESQTA
ncbi:MAG: isobutyryl-CoA mutase small subunit, partial [Acidimicrobiaceae bacterium]|nr:isobutyryl-CoA mutase small subunit [Acidimicrobiaceae bacterium]